MRIQVVSSEEVYLYDPLGANNSYNTLSIPRYLCFIV